MYGDDKKRDDWQVFQTDVLDVLRQYEGYFDFFEPIGSMDDDSRPDCVTRVSREEKKEVWVIDAKNKHEIGDEDLERMEHYVNVVESNPGEIGLDVSEISDYNIRGIFVTSSGERKRDKFEQVKFSGFHQFLQKELVYTDTDKVVSDIAKMVERKELSQAQARLLFNSIKPFERSIKRAIEVLEEIETRYIGLKLHKPPISSFDKKVPVDAVLTHDKRGKVFLFDIPYSRKEVEEPEEKVQEIRNEFDNVDKEVFYAVINRFEPKNGEYMYNIEDLEEEVQKTAGIVSPDNIAELFTPKIPVEKAYEDNSVVVRDTAGLGFKLEVKSHDDINHSIDILLPQEAANELRELAMNSRKTMGELKNNRFNQKIKINQDLEVLHDEVKEPWISYRESVKGIYQSSVSPALARKNNKVS